MTSNAYFPPGTRSKHGLRFAIFCRPYARWTGPPTTMHCIDTLVASKRSPIQTNYVRPFLRLITKKRAGVSPPAPSFDDTRVIFPPGTCPLADDCDSSTHDDHDPAQWAHPLLHATGH